MAESYEHTCERCGHGNTVTPPDELIAWFAACEECDHILGAPPHPDDDRPELFRESEQAIDPWADTIADRSRAATDGFAAGHESQ